MNQNFIKTILKPRVFLLKPSVTFFVVLRLKLQEAIQMENREAQHRTSL